MRALIASVSSLVLAAMVPLLPVDEALAAGAGLITRPSNYSVQETAQRFENAIRSKGWVVFTEIPEQAKRIASQFDDRFWTGTEFPQVVAA